jgi:hypothetical protein
MKRSVIGGVLVAVTAAGSLAGATLSISPSAQTVSVGSRVSIDLMISGTGTAVGTFDINIGFDPGVLSYSDTTFGNQLDVFGLGDVRSVTPGVFTVELFELSLDSVSDLNSHQASSFRLATLSFNALSSITNSPITITVNALGDASGNSLSAVVQNGSVTVGPLTLSKCDANQDGVTKRCRRAARHQ